MLPDQGESLGGQEDPRVTLRVVRVVAVDQLPDNSDKLRTGLGVQLDAVRIPRTING